MNEFECGHCLWVTVKGESEKHTILHQRNHVICTISGLTTKINQTIFR